MSSQRPIIGYTAELERQAGDDEGREEDRQKALSGASEGDGLALGGVEGLSSAGVSATANLQGVTSRFDWYLDRVVHFERSGTLTVNHDVVRATSDLDSDCFMRHFQGCCHLRSRFAPLTWAHATLSPYKSTLSYLIRPVSTKISTQRQILLYLRDHGRGQVDAGAAALLAAPREPQRRGTVDLRRPEHRRDGDEPHRHRGQGRGGGTEWRPHRTGRGAPRERHQDPRDRRSAVRQRRSDRRGGPAGR